jgi:hypothetical protein
VLVVAAVLLVTVKAAVRADMQNYGWTLLVLAQQL